MNIRVMQFNNQGMDSNALINKIVVVIDVFRATSVMVTALAHAAKEVVICSTQEEAIMEYKIRNGNDCILAGESGMHKIDGFDYGNTPQSFTGGIENKTVILTTTNGTKAMRLGENAETLYVASLLNSGYIAESLLKDEKDVCIICSGSRGNFSIEDSFCAGKILHRISQQKEIVYDDFGLCLMSMYQSAKDETEKFLRKSSAYQLLSKNGFEDDAQFCMQEDIYKIAPKAKNSCKNIITI